MNPLRSEIAALNSFALILARTADKSGASLVVGVSTALAADGIPASKPPATNRARPKVRARIELLMFMNSPFDNLQRHPRVGGDPCNYPDIFGSVSWVPACTGMTSSVCLRGSKQWLPEITP